MRGEEGVIQVIETVIMIEKGSGTGIEIMEGQGNGMVGLVGMTEGGWIGGLGMEEMVEGVGTVIVAGHAPLLGRVRGGHLEVQFAHIRGFC